MVLASVGAAAAIAAMAFTPSATVPTTVEAVQAQLNAVPWIAGDRDLADPAGPGDPDLTDPVARGFLAAGWRLSDAPFSGSIDDGPAVTIELDGAPACATTRVSAVGQSGQIVAVRITPSACN